MSALTIAYITSRRKPKLCWFFDSLSRQIVDRMPLVIVVDHFFPRGPLECEKMFVDIGAVQHVAPKPNIWNGPHRLPRENWWAKSNALNTAIALCKTDWLAMVDDRSVLMPGWLDCIYEAMHGGYAVCGSYEKHLKMKVENGVIVDPGITDSIDHRHQSEQPYRTKDWYGGHGALPLGWCLEVNGFSEDLCDSLGLEDCMFGQVLHNRGLPICYDSRMKIIEDRTQGEIDGALKRTDKGVSPNDKSHAIVERLRDKTDSQNSFNLREIRDHVQAGEPFPAPTASHFDWFDGSLISEFE